MHDLVTALLDTQSVCLQQNPWWMSYSFGPVLLGLPVKVNLDDGPDTHPIYQAAPSHPLT